MEIQRLCLVVASDNQDVVDRYARLMMGRMQSVGCTITRNIGYWKGEREITHTICVHKVPTCNSSWVGHLCSLAEEYKHYEQQDAVMAYVSGGTQWII